MLTSNDERQLRGQGIALEEAHRQLGLLAGRPRYLNIDRPCTLGDGIERLDDDEVVTLHALHDGAARQGRFHKFVPASGAASRMFESLLSFGLGHGLTPEKVSELESFLRLLPRYPFYDELTRWLRGQGDDVDRLAAAGEAGPILEALVGATGLDYARRPKGLLPFHRYPEGSRTPFEEHLVEGAQYAADAEGCCRLHFTVSDEHRRDFEEFAHEVEPNYRVSPGVPLQIDLSIQKSAMDTLALEETGQALRDGENTER
jgi:hypothetical protein